MKRFVLPGLQREILISTVSFLVIASGIGFPISAAADTNAPPPPPPTRAMDEFGVNLIAGSPSLPMPTISTAGLSETMNNIGLTDYSGVTDYTDSFTGYLIDYSRTPGAAGGSADIVIGSRRLQPGADIFADGCISNICTYWDKDGIAYKFDTTKSSEGWEGIIGKTSMLVQIKKPDGETIDISLVQAQSNFVTTDTSGYYVSHHVATFYPTNAVSSNGWMVKYEYIGQSYPFNGTNTYYAQVPKKIYIINTAFDYCSTSATSCTSTNSPIWPTWNITYPRTYSDASNTQIGKFYATAYQSPSGLSKTYGFAIQTHRVTDAYINGMHATYVYNWADWSPGVAPYIITGTKPNGATYTIRAENAAWQYTQNGNNSFVYFYLYQPSQFTDEIGRVTKYEYNNDNTAYRADNRTLKRIIPPGASYSGGMLTGGYTEYGYDARRNITSISVYPSGGGTPQVIRYEYETTCTSATYIYCNKVKKSTDAKGNVTTYTYSNVHGQILTETGPADATGVRPETRYTYAQLYPQILNSSGTLISSTPVWRLIKKSSCMTASTTNNASCVNSAQETVTEYEYGTKNLLLTKITNRAGNAVVANPASPTNVWASTTFDYDIVGNQIMVDGPLPGTVDRSYTVYDIRGRPVYEIGVDPDGGGILPSVAVHHMYDIDGREYRTETGRGNGTNMRTCSPTAATCSYFTVTSYIQRTYDATTGLEVKSITAQP